MTDVVSIEEAKAHLRIDPAFVDDDTLIEIYIAAAERACIKQIGLSFDDPAFNQDDLAIVAQAVLLILGHWWVNREAATMEARGTPAEMPLAVTWLLQPISRRVLA